jgi:mono/diheme cytochrome c family protein
MAPRPFSLLLALLPAAGIAAELWTAPPETREQASPLPAGEAAVEAGRALYEKRCRSCHGEQGRGDGRAAAYMRVKPRDLTVEEVQAQTDGELYWKVTTGRRPMPGFESKLGDEERWQVVAYVRELAALHGQSTAE